MSESTKTGNSSGKASPKPAAAPEADQGAPRMNEDPNKDTPKEPSNPTATMEVAEARPPQVPGDLHASSAHPAAGQQQILHFYEAQMRDHAAAYASAAAGAAWAAAQIAADMAQATGGDPTMASPPPNHPHFPRALPVPPHMFPTLPSPMPTQYPPFGPTSPPYGMGPPFLDPSNAGIPPMMYSPPNLVDFGTGGYSPSMEMMPQYSSTQGGPLLPEEGGGEGEGGSDTYGHRRRKRQQRMPPSDAGGGQPPPSPRNPPHPQHPYHHHQPQLWNGNSERRGRRRRVRTDGMADAHGEASVGMGYSGVNNNNSNRRARIRKIMASSNSSDGGSSGAAGNFSKKKKARPPNDDSLLGKTGVSALYEWCGKRRTTPTFTLQQPDPASPPAQAPDPTTSTPKDTGDAPSAFGSPASSSLHSGADAGGGAAAPPLLSTTAAAATEEARKSNRATAMPDEFEMSVSIDGMEWGRGRGRTKSAAKQEAARRALLALLPGVVFEEASGILVQLPSSCSRGGRRNNIEVATITPAHRQAPWKATTSMEDLAPNLAKRLAIGHEDDEEQQQKGQGLSATTAETGRSEYSKKRPSKWHGVYPGTTTTSEEEDGNVYYASRGASVCSALLHAMVQIDERIPEAPSYSYEVATVSSSTSAGEAPSSGHAHKGEAASHLKRKAATAGNIIPTRTPILVHRGPFTCKATMRLRERSGNQKEAPAPGEQSYTLLEAVGLGGTKREARHTASAQLLLQLFPECEGMVQVKEAAEAARERYAASKALKQQSKRERAFMSKNHRWNETNENETNLAFATAPQSSTITLPSSIEEHVLNGFGVSDQEGRRLSPTATDEEGCSALQLSRQNQLDEKVNAALQKLNDHDDDGRSVPYEPTADDVGRTVLRRATSEDVHWVTKLLDDAGHPSSPVSILGQPTSSNSVDSSLVDNEASSSIALKLWSSSTIILLLCRAIAPHEDPPLGCAVLTLGFSMSKGRTLRVAQIGSKPHLPHERFIECLESFASRMHCSLQTRKLSPSMEQSVPVTVLGRSEIRRILMSHIPSMKETQLGSELSTGMLGQSKGHFREESSLALVSPLQSVQEESDGVEDNNTDALNEKRFSKDQDNPCKRSRVQ